ncbi:MAG: thermonuclease family protein, partial [Methylococcales bacterium]
MKTVLILFLCLCSCTEAAVYEWRDANGNKHYTDQAAPDAKMLDIKPGYSFVSVKKIYDGDTIELADGSKIRLLGVNTPEVKHYDKQADAGGDEAKRWLTAKLNNRKVRLVHDIEKTDKYGRTLAHVFTDSKEHINVQLVAEGLAEVSIYPPNMLFTDDFLKAQAQAEQRKLGIWQRPEYTPIPITALTEQGHTGWTRLFGKVEEIHQTKKFTYLVFNNQFEVRIAREWLNLFPDLLSYPGKNLE